MESDTQAPRPEDFERATRYTGGSARAFARLARVVQWGDSRSLDEIVADYAISQRRSRARHYIAQQEREKKLDAISWIACAVCVLAVAVAFALSL